MADDKTVLEILIDDFKMMAESARRGDEALAAILGEKYDADAPRGVAEAWRAATDAHAAYVESLEEHREDDNDPGNGPMDRASRAAKERESAQQKINEAQKKLAGASVDEMEQRGLLTHQQALAARLQLDAQYEQRRLALAHEADGQELELKQRTADIVAKQETEAEAGVATSQAASDQAAVRAAALKGRLARDKTDEAAGEDQMKKSSVTDEDLANYEGGRGLKDKAQRDESSAQKQSDAAESSAEKARRVLERQQHLLETKTSQLDRLQREVDELRATQQAREQNDATVSGIDAQTAAVKNGAAIPRGAFASPAAAAAAGPSAPAPETAAIQSMIDALQHGQSQQAIAIANSLQRNHQLSNLNTHNLIGLVEQAVRDHQANAARIARIEAQIFHGRNQQGGQG